MKKRLIFALVLLASTAVADEPQRHIVKAGDTCASLAQKYYGDSRLVDVIHRANAELADKPPPHDLKEGTVLLIPAKPPGGAFPDAQLTTVRNHVEVLSPQMKEGKPNDPLFRGNRVSTEEQSAADVTFRDETQVKLGERTLVVILGDAKGAAQKVTPTDVQTTLITGNLRAFMPTARRTAPPATVATDAAKVRMYSGEAQITADPKKTTRLAVYQGSSTIDARGKTREVARGYGSKAENGKQPTVPRPLPPAPVFTVAPPLVVHDQGAPKITAEYDVPKTETTIGEWHVQIAHDGLFRDVVADTKAAGDVKKLEVQVPGAGRHYIHVSAIDQDGFEGPWGRTARTLVVKENVEALAGGRRTITLLPNDAFCLRVGNVKLARVEGAIEAGKTEPVQVRCAPHDSDPTTLLVLGATLPPSPSRQPSQPPRD